MTAFQTDPASFENRLAALEARVRGLEAKLGQTSAPSPEAPLDPDDASAWLDQVAALAARGDRSEAITLYMQNMSSSEQEAASFVDDLVGNPPAPG